MVKRKESATVDVKIRMKEPLRAAIERAAKRRGVSMNSEMTDRLERSLRDEAWAVHAFEARYGKRLAGMIEILARAMDETGRHVGFWATGTLDGATNWFDVPYAFDQATKAAIAILDALKPPGDPSPVGAILAVQSQLPPDFAENVGESFALGFLRAVSDEEHDGQFADWAAGPRAMLGPIGSRLEKFAVRTQQPKNRKEKS